VPPSSASTSIVFRRATFHHLPATRRPARGPPSSRATIVDPASRAEAVARSRASDHGAQASAAPAAVTSGSKWIRVITHEALGLRTELAGGNRAGTRSEQAVLNAEQPRWERSATVLVPSWLRGRRSLTPARRSRYRFRAWWRERSDRAPDARTGRHVAARPEAELTVALREGRASHEAVFASCAGAVTIGPPLACRIEPMSPRGRRSP
jgi:hypothetical protein